MLSVEPGSTYDSARFDQHKFTLRKLAEFSNSLGKNGYSFGMGHVDIRADWDGPALLPDTNVSAHGPVVPIGERLHLPPGAQKRFVVSVDTEEEFDWHAPFNRGSNTSTTIAAMPGVTERFNAAGVKPVFLCDWPVIDSLESGTIMRDLARSGMCEIGTHLHPWVNPPHEEVVNRHNSFTGNLSEPLQWQKLKLLTERIEDVIGTRPIVYRAGRYGIGPKTYDMLAKLGYQFDVSVRAHFDYTPEDGPDFSHYPCWPWRTAEGLISLPLSTAQTGLLRHRKTLPNWSILRGAAGKLGVQNRIPLTPEGTPVEEALTAIDRLHRDGIEVFSLSFHSPTVTPGNTDYVKNADDLTLFWAWWDAVLNRFAALGVLPATHADLADLWTAKS